MSKTPMHLTMDSFSLRKKKKKKKYTQFLNPCSEFIQTYAKPVKYNP